MAILHTKGFHVKELRFPGGLRDWNLPSFTSI